jgi:hypothetical protein
MFAKKLGCGPAYLLSFAALDRCGEALGRQRGPDGVEHRLGLNVRLGAAGRVVQG